MGYIVYHSGILPPVDDREVEVRVLPTATEFFMTWLVLRLMKKGWGENTVVRGLKADGMVNPLRAGSRTGKLLKW